MPKSIGAPLGKGEGGRLLVAVHQQEVAARSRPRHREVDGKGRLADTALSVSDCQYHSALAPLAIWLRCSSVCKAKGYTFYRYDGRRGGKEKDSKVIYRTN